MFISEIKIKNYRLFPKDSYFELKDINVPDGTNKGTGLTVIVGENGCGKSSLLEALSLALLPYKKDTFSLEDFNSLKEKVSIEVISDAQFDVSKTMPKGTFKAKGFMFDGRIRSRSNKSYFSTLTVNDQLFIKADEASVKDGSPDLRVSVDNPFSGPRFSENDIYYLDKNRIFQVRSGTYNTTRFDKLMEDLDFQYLHGKSLEPEDMNSTVGKIVKNEVESSYLEKAIEKFKEMTNEDIKLDIMNNARPFKNSFFAKNRAKECSIKLEGLGSGYEMVFAILYNYFLAQQSGKQLILLIDEPELHLHPSLQAKVARLLLEISKNSQIIIATHSPLFVKQIYENKNVKTDILLGENGKVTVSEPEAKKLSYISANEINFIAYKLPTEEYHNELYEELKNEHGSGLKIKPFDESFFQKIKKESSDFPHNGVANSVSIHTHLRNQIHHRGECGKAKTEDIEKSIEVMRSWL